MKISFAIQTHFSKGDGIARTARKTGLSRSEVSAFFVALRKHANQVRVIAAKQVKLSVKSVYVPKSEHSQRVLKHLGETTSECNVDQTKTRAKVLRQHSYPSVEVCQRNSTPVPTEVSAERLIEAFREHQIELEERKETRIAARGGRKPIQTYGAANERRFCPECAKILKPTQKKFCSQTCVKTAFTKDHKKH